MSRTFKTRPLDVRIFDPKDKKITREEIHNHANGRECDLPEPDAKSQLEHLENPDIAHKCYWKWSYNGRGVCGCPQCTGKYEHKEENRRTRHSAKKEIDKALAEEI